MLISKLFRKSSTGLQSILRIEQNALHDRTNTFFRLSKQLNHQVYLKLKDRPHFEMGMGNERAKLFTCFGFVWFRTALQKGLKELLRLLYLYPTEFQKKKYTFRGIGPLHQTHS